MSCGGGSASISGERKDIPDDRMFGFATVKGAGYQN